ncbi:MAG: hypothetical protein J5764_00150 [Bacteroidales bacterium]|nr:hypothetical protein [Bacteroidales bacterium]
MTKVIYILASAFCLASCSCTKPGPEPEPEPTYKNSFVLLGSPFSAESKLSLEKEGEELWSGLWQASDKLSVINAETGTSIGEASLTAGEGSATGTWTLKTNSDAGITVRMLYPSTLDANAPALSSTQSCTASQDGAPLSSSQTLAWSDAVLLEASWPTEFILESPASYIRVSVSMPDGASLAGSSLKSFKISCPGKALSGSFSTDFQANSLSPLPSSADWVEAAFAAPAALSSKEVSFLLCVFPADLRGADCRFTASLLTKKGEAASVSGTFKGRKLEAGAVYTLSVDALGGLTIPADKSLPEYSYVDIDYKVNGTDNSYKKGQQITVNGMNWMARYNTDPCDCWGGLPGVKPDEICSSNPAGFWRTGKFHGRHVMVDPDGNIAMLHGMNGVAPDIMKEATSQLSQKEFKAKFGTDFTAWAQWANKILVNSHFNFYSTNMNRVSRYKDFITAEIENTLHNYTDESRVSQVELALLLRTFSWDYYTASHSQRGYNNAEVNIAALMFDPYYLPYIDGIAAEAATISRGKADFIGWYLDNELQFRWSGDSKPGIYLKDWLLLNEGPDYCQANGYAKKFAQEFMREKYGVEPVPANVTDAMENAFLEEVVRYYYRTASEAIRRHDPDHLVIGSRLHGLPRQLPQVVKACAEYCDIVSINIYSMWVPEDSYFKSQYSVWVSDFDKPFMVSEFYVRDADSKYEGQPYSRTGEGGGWYVKGQADRGRFYQGFTRKLVSYDNCVGWQWFQMTDDYAESYNGWNNKGIVSPKYVPYTDCLSYMAQLNRNIYQIMDYYKPGITENASTDAVPYANWK